MTATADKSTTLPVLRPGAAILVRRADRIQIGCDPERSTILDLTPPVTADTVVALLRYLDDQRTQPELTRYLRSIGLTAADFAVLSEQLLASGAVLPSSGGPRVSHLRVRIHGRGPIAEKLADSLRDVGLPTTRSVQRPRLTGRPGNWSGTQLAILTDYHSHDPAIVNILMRQRIPHLGVRLRDGVGIVGPLVLPGLSSCLRCADHHRATLDPQWPMIAAQLLGKPGYASAATIRATVALAHEQVEQIVAGLSESGSGSGSGHPNAASPPDLIDHTLEFHANPVRLRRKRWPAHPSCTCGAAAR
ncbi:hypothetical protein GOEFS_001_00060 [Gordonia effusa NBRC 100432]|uniref:Bacteriocin biosynthesis cyclodehydratase domain-containing protein n=1 Tax=Gordonia effusa NBRC 100432 TaxID=1077974 RepID=H0QUG0_9ACTN|nr:hypothetical protein [Gordonia effusa]GAB16461.1 hypothetical protein GOEFS_001_00060 [Gordonia effusa NBRC 100432]